jgi:hypothetical protein
VTTWLEVGVSRAAETARQGEMAASRPLKSVLTACGDLSTRAEAVHDGWSVRDSIPFPLSYFEISALPAANGVNLLNHLLSFLLYVRRRFGSPRAVHFRLHFFGGRRSLTSACGVGRASVGHSDVIWHLIKDERVPRQSAQSELPSRRTAAS